MRFKASCRVGTTVATNALLEHKGHRFAFVTTKGFKDVCRIGNQTRPNMFTSAVKKAEALHGTSIEVDERVTIEDYDLNPHKKEFTEADLQEPSLVKTASGEVIRVIKKPDADEVRQQLLDLRSLGYDNLAISFMHSYVYPQHEQLVAKLAREVGFKHVITSHETAPVIKLLIRSSSVSSEAYLYPVIQDYIENFKAGFKVLPKRLDFMCSDGGLKGSDRIRGNEALLSGPAGGVVGVAKSCFDETDGTPLIGFDMGGTSTDVSRFDGKYDFLSETTIAGRSINVSMLNIATVAAGGGSILFARHGLLVVGPESAGAHPGPACYRKGGPLTVADANLFLGRLVVSSFPSIFGPNADQPLDIEIVKSKFKEITDDFNAQTDQNLTPEEVAQGFCKQLPDLFILTPLYLFGAHKYKVLRQVFQFPLLMTTHLNNKRNQSLTLGIAVNVANETMSRPIRNATEARGFAPEKHNLVSFGGAGGQHACSIADKLGIGRILIHKWSSLLSAYGISQAELQFEAIAPYSGKFSMQALSSIRARLDDLKSKVTRELLSQGANERSIVFDESLILRYFGSDTTIVISKPDDEDYAKAFIADHLREFAFTLGRDVIVDSIKVRGVGAANDMPRGTSVYEELASLKASTISNANQTGEQPLYVNSAWQAVDIYDLNKISKGSFISGPALVIDETQTILVEPHFQAYVLPNHIVLERKQKNQPAPASPNNINSDTAASDINPIQLSVFAHRFMSIAEQMGNTLQRTAISTSIKERLDFSCAIFSPEGELVANAPHVPMHLGSMQMAIKVRLLRSL